MWMCAIMYVCLVCWPSSFIWGHLGVRLPKFVYLSCLNLSVSIDRDEMWYSAGLCQSDKIQLHFILLDYYSRERTSYYLCHEKKNQHWLDSWCFLVWFQSNIVCLWYLLSCRLTNPQELLADQCNLLTSQQSCVTGTFLFYILCKLFKFVDNCHAYKCHRSLPYYTTSHSLAWPWPWVNRSVKSNSCLVHLVMQFSTGQGEIWYRVEDFSNSTSDTILWFQNCLSESTEYRQLDWSYEKKNFLMH